MSRWANSGVIGVARRKGHSAHTAERPLITQPKGLGAGFAMLDSHAFRNAMNVLIARAKSVFTILVIRPQQGQSTLALGEKIIHQLRNSSGDLVGYLEGAIAVALHATDHVGAVAFADRVRDEWRRSGRGELQIDIAEHPYAEQRVIELLTANWSTSAFHSVVIDDGGDADQLRRATADEKRTGIADRQ